MKTGKKTAGMKSHEKLLSLQASETEPSADSRCAELASRVAEAAYYKAEARGFQPGHEMDDWLGAEKETMQ